ncbi:PssE/Cps14G family polysaccharide biosynthesis glycosyltransferase [Clostridium sp. CF012]|uniref:PssE/Cps14G family polysaccharide biosynthesis glycosyltransferase n=1 Tax=Clostridium sp. CF012 TaxID=2843319 RepID=UPI001C0E5914|nr:PssE/Cps14G family polysaccharide biosynthesis glycosyltransferase [Clostridium sp. CF012]MBU3142586.1 glycosyl transferase family 28 [Clostridium sp. CF012]
MIFVTVGTHEQQFNRLIKKVDELKGKNIIKEEVFMQIGYSNYLPVNCDYKKLLTYEEMTKYIMSANIIITHGGPGSIFLPLKYNKVPIVVPRNPLYKEHVDEHQIKFVKKMESQNRIIAVYDIEEIEENIVEYNHSLSKIAISNSSNLDSFIEKIEEICNGLLSN